MRVLTARNVNDLYVQGLELLASDGVHGSSRAGPVIAAPYPVMSVYEQPKERVLFDEQRDASPFFHLMEGLWMLSGRDDAAFLDRYIGDFSSRFSDNGVVHGAYGHRWRHALGFDQLERIVGRLSADQHDRQAVLQMWDARTPRCPAGECDAPGTGMSDLTGDWRDRPCNTHAYFRVRQEMMVDGLVGSYTSKTGMWPVLDMTISCRSNDVVWGAYGANAVHFSMLQEYVAGRLGFLVGKMYQLSNNYHGYVNVLDGLGDPRQIPDTDHYDNATVHSVAMGTRWDQWDGDLRVFMGWHDYDMTSLDDVDSGVTGVYDNEWFAGTAQNVAVARLLWTLGEKQRALDVAGLIEAPDWRMACEQWMQRRMQK